MRGLRFATPFLLALLFVAGGSSRPQDTGADYTPPAPPPAELQAHFDELSQKLTAFGAQIDAAWDGSVGSGQFAGSLASANGNKSVGLLSAATWTRTLEMLDAYEAMGVEMIKIDLNYPVLTPAFHTFLQANPPPLVPNYVYTAQNFIGTPNSFYNKLAAEIRSRGLGLWIEHGTLFANYSPTPPGRVGPLRPESGQARLPGTFGMNYMVSLGGMIAGGTSEIQRNPPEADEHHRAAGTGATAGIGRFAPGFRFEVSGYSGDRGENRGDS